MWGDWGGHGMGWGIFGAVHMILWWVLIILGIVVLIKWLFGGSSRRESGTSDRAIEILKERYARGEIGKDEFEQKRRDLSG
ncbi:MAG: SHOCT domain-containing protein [Betaproteobacteria bacterium]|jgi:putative membrane protein|nr:MAG: SHOCT domain-containing protein [Betaproteobacteria bacterium]